MTEPRPAYLVVPKPPSTNHLFRNVEKVGRVMTNEYRQWLKVAGEYLLAQRPVPVFTEPVELTLYTGEKGVANMDASNTLKAVEDFLVKNRVIKDDSRKYVRSSRAVWVPFLRNAMVEIIPARPAPTIDAVLRRAPPQMHQFLR